MMNQYDRIYTLLINNREISEVSLKMAAGAAGRARVSRRGTTRSRPYIRHLSDTEAQISRVKGKLQRREIANRGPGTRTTPQFGTARVPDPHTNPSNPGIGGRHETVQTSWTRNVPKRSLYSGGRKETTAQTVSRKFDKAAKKAEKGADKQ